MKERDAHYRQMDSSMLLGGCNSFFWHQPGYCVYNRYTIAGVQSTMGPQQQFRPAPVPYPAGAEPPEVAKGQREIIMNDQ